MVSKDIAAEAASIDAAVEGKTLIAIFDRNAYTYGDKAAIHWKEGDLWRHLTWKQYQVAAHEAAAGLISLGVQPRDFVAIMAGNRREHVIADLGAIHAGAAGVTIYSTLAQNQIQYVASNCGGQGGRARGPLLHEAMGGDQVGIARTRVRRVDGGSG